MTWKSKYQLSFNKLQSKNQKPQFSLDSDSDFPTLDLASSPSLNTETLQYDHIQDNTKPNTKNSNESKLEGWLYLTIDKTTNKVLWDDYSYGNWNLYKIENDEKNEAFLQRWCEDFELEKEEFILNYGYDEYKKHYYINDDLQNDEDIGEEGYDSFHDEFGEYSDEDYV